jgi:hypothetical protein
MSMSQEAFNTPQQFHWKEGVVFLILAAAYFFSQTYKSFGSYFTVDDFNTLSWAHLNSFWQTAADALNPAKMANVDTYRPVGGLFYRLMYNFFGLNFLGFHLVANLIHLFNCLLVYRIMRALGTGKLAAFTGGLLFTFQLFMLPIYWEFSTVFDILCTAFAFLSFLLYILQSQRRIHSFAVQIIPIILFFLAIRSKEMALPLPLVLSCYEFLFCSEGAGFKSTLIRILKKQWAYYALALTFAIPKVYAVLSVGNPGSYALVLTLQSLMSGTAFYLAEVFNEKGISPWILLVALLLCLSLAINFRKRKLLIFGFLYTCLMFLPVVFLYYHRAGFFWYLPSLGMAIYTGGFLELVRDNLYRVTRTSLESLVMLLAFILALICYSSLGRAYVSPRAIHTKASQENWYLHLYGDYRNFVEQLEAYHLSPRGESTLIFVGPPLYFDRLALEAMVRCLYHDETIDVRLADSPSANAPIQPDSDAFLIVYENRRVKVTKCCPAGVQW